MPLADPEARKAYNRRYYLENKERRLASISEWQTNNRDRVKGYKQAWFDANPQYKREWYLANRERFLEQTKANAKRRREEDPERMKAMDRDRIARRRARQREAFVEHVDTRLVWERDQGICGICGQSADANDWHLDHITPIIRGGEHSYANVQVAHPYCNRSKAAS